MGNSISDLGKQLYLSIDKQQLLLLPSPIKEAINAIELSHIITQSEYGSLKKNPDGISKAIESFSKFQNGITEQKDLKPIVVAERFDAQLNISTDDLELTATAKIITAYGGHPITLDQITQELKTLKICYGISKKTLHLLITKSKKAKPGTLYQAVIATGTKPINGCNATFERLVETPSERIMKPQLLDNGRVDMRNLGQLVTVTPGTLLMRKIPYQIGTPGTTVTGETIKQKEGEDFTFNIGENTELSPTDENSLIASIAGIPHETSNGMTVNDALIIENVDISFGNVDYDGNVIIAGDICDGMKVKASGDVTVAGFIESANIECSGDLFVAKGILGRKNASDDNPFSCYIDCQGSVTAAFSQYTEMHVGKDLHIKNQLLHCMVLCQGHIKVQNDFGNKGVILGGLLAADKGISTVTLGAIAGTKTTIDLIGIYSELIVEKKLIKSVIQQQEQILQSIVEARLKIAAVPLSEKKKTIEARLTQTQKDAEKKIKLLNIELEDNVIALQEYANNSKVVALKKLYNQVSIAIGSEKFFAQESYGPSCVSIQEDKLTVSPYLP